MCLQAARRDVSGHSQLNTHWSAFSLIVIGVIKEYNSAAVEKCVIKTAVGLYVYKYMLYLYMHYCSAASF